jgi:ligand-binding sensor domain-containing protein
MDTLHRTKGEFVHFRYDPNGMDVDNIMSIYKDHTNLLWVGGRNGLAAMDRGGRIMKHYRHNGVDQRSLSNDHVMSICEDSLGSLWVGTGRVRYRECQERKWTRELAAAGRRDWRNARD